MTRRSSLDFSRYIGIPYSSPTNRVWGGLNCWELVELIMIEAFEVTPPEYTYTDDFKKVGPFFVNKLSQWQEIDEENRQAGDVVLLSVTGQPVHLGILVDRDTMIHTLEGHDSASENINRVSWRKRIRGFYRWNK